MNKAMLLKKYLSYHKKSSARLPSAYQEVEYIESTGTQYIALNTPITSDYNIEIDYERTGTINFLLGTSKQSVFHFCLGGDFAIRSTGWNAYSYTTTGNREVIRNEGKYWYLNDSLAITTSDVPSITTEYGLTLFVYNVNGVINSGTFSSYKLFNFKEYYGNELKANYIPCYRKSDNEVGLYDIVNNQFYTNQGTGSFISGRPLVNIDGYEQLDYIESSGTQYILISDNSNIYPTSDLDVNATFSASKGYLFSGGYNIGSSNYIYAFESTGIYIRNIFSSWTSTDLTSYFTTNQKHTIVNKSNQVYCDGNLVATTQSVSFSNTSYKIAILGYRYVNSMFSGEEMVGKLYHIAFNRNSLNQMVFNAIPMRKISTNELGLYDIVNKVFYTNQGSGTFIAGGKL